MVFELVVGLLAAGLAVTMLVRQLRRAALRRRMAATMFVTTYPDIELEQAYGGWDADAYDALPDPSGVITPLHIQPGMPSRWARLF